MVTSYVASLLIVFCLAYLFSENIPFCRRIVDGLGAREPQIDGLRGLCAIMVVLHHLVFFYYYKSGDKWGIPATDNFCYNAGKAGVALFFLICAYLFWGKIARSANFSSFNWKSFSENRVRRLLPMFLVAVTLGIIVLGFIDRHFTLSVSLPTLSRQILSAYSFSFFPLNGNFNGSFLAFASISVSWTLRMEWIFYCSLPLIAALKVRRYWFIILPALIVINELWRHSGYYEFFLYGSICFELSRIPRLALILRGPASSIVSISVLIVASAVLKEPSSGLPALCIAIAFLPIACGNDWFGFLSMSGSRLVGAISYSTYLLNILLAALVTKVVSVHLLTRTIVFPVVMVCSCIFIVMVSLMTYKTIELPFQMRRPARSPALAGYADVDENKIDRLLDPRSH